MNKFSSQVLQCEFVRTLWLPRGSDYFFFFFFVIFRVFFFLIALLVKSEKKIKGALKQGLPVQG